MNSQPLTHNLIDTHAHLMWPSFKKDFKEVLNRSFESNVKTIINIGTDFETSSESLKLDCFPLKNFSSIGIHPHEINKLSTSESIHKYIEELQKLYRESGSKIVAVGECGLDYFQNKFNTSSLSEEKQKLLQKELFVAQINLAKKINLPLVVHNRDSWDDIFLPQMVNTKGVFHSFTGSFEQAQKILELGFYLGINCTITYPKNEQLRKTVKLLPLDKILTETDCPFLPPQNQRGQRNEPANIVEIIKIIAEIKSLPFEKVAEITFQNAKTLFKLT